MKLRSDNYLGIGGQEISPSYKKENIKTATIGGSWFVFVP